MIRSGRGLTNASPHFFTNMECDQEILAETVGFVCTLCHKCGVVHIHDGMYSLGFTVPALKEWGRQILKLSYTKHCRSDGNLRYLTIYSYLHYHELHFFEDEFEEFKDLIGQSLAMLEVYEIIGNTD